MPCLTIKAALSGVMAAAVAEIAKRSPAFGALVASLPLISIMAVIWLWRDTSDTARIAAHMEATFWYVLPSLPMLPVMPASCALTVVLYFITALGPGDVWHRAARGACFLSLP